LQVASEIFFAIGINGYGTAGAMMIFVAFQGNDVVLAIMYIVATILWGCTAVYNVWIFNKARIVWNHLGGVEGAKKDFTKQASQTAYDNRETIIQVAKDNKETIKQVAIDNKDTIIQFAKDNKETVARVAYENKGTIYENREAVTAVWTDTKNTSHV